MIDLILEILKDSLKAVLRDFPQLVGGTENIFRLPHIDYFVTLLSKLSFQHTTDYYTCFLHVLRIDKHLYLLFCCLVPIHFSPVLKHPNFL